MKLKLLIIYLVVAFSKGFSISDAELIDKFPRKDIVLLLSVPKAGTNLISKCLELMEIEDIEFVYILDPIVDKRTIRHYQEKNQALQTQKVFNHFLGKMKKDPQLRSFIAHLPYNHQYSRVLKKCTSKNFLMLRDPRDQLVSMVCTAIKDPYNRTPQEISNIISDILEHKQRYNIYYPSHNSLDYLWTVGFVNFNKSFIRWAYEPNFYVVHFEKLIGAHGGGTDEMQIQEIKNIAAHLGVKLSKAKINFISKNLFGDSNTFKEGQTRSWEKYFTPEVKKAFKDLPGACEILIEMGYEKDTNW